MSYRDQAKLAVKKRKAKEKNDRYLKFQELKKANEVRFDKQKKRSPKGAVSVTFEGFGSTNNNSNNNNTPNNPEPPLFDGTIEPLMAGGIKKPFADNGFGGLTSSLSKASLMQRPQFQTWEKHINSEGKIFFHNPSQKKSRWNLPPCSILVDCTEDEVIGDGGIDEPADVPFGTMSSPARGGRHQIGDNMNGGEQDSDPLRSIFASHPVWEQNQLLGSEFDVSFLEPTSFEEQHEHLTERLIDRDMQKRGINPTQIKYHDLKAGDLNPKRPSDRNRNRNRNGMSPDKISPRKRNLQNQPATKAAAVVGVGGEGEGSIKSNTTSARRGSFFGANPNTNKVKKSRKERIKEREAIEQKKRQSRVERESNELEERMVLERKASQEKILLRQKKASKKKERKENGVKSDADKKREGLAIKKKEIQARTAEGAEQAREEVIRKANAAKVAAKGKSGGGGGGGDGGDGDGAGAAAEAKKKKKDAKRLRLEKRKQEIIARRAAAAEGGT